jgi:hypothetical protein
MVGGPLIHWILAAFAIIWAVWSVYRGVRDSDTMRLIVGGFILLVAGWVGFVLLTYPDRQHPGEDENDPPSAHK